jgi:hypothetical protein
MIHYELNQIVICQKLSQVTEYFSTKKTTLKDKRFLDKTFTNSLVLRRRGRTLVLLVYYYQWVGN